MSRGLTVVLGTMLFFAGCSAFAQDAQLILPGATGQTAIFDSFDNLIVVTRTVPAGYMQLFKAYDGSYRDPVVVVEGFDPTNGTAPTDFYGTLNSRGTLDAARAAGRSVWIVNFGDGAGALSANARLVSSAVAQAANYGGLSSATVDVVGLSMGGVIARYALAYDEQYGGPTDGAVGVYVSGDSPHQGANGNPSVQEFALFTGDPEYMLVVNSDAALSMIHLSVRDYSTNGCFLGALPSATDWVGSTAAHDWFYAQLNSLNGDGYPHKCRNVAVSNGTWDPQPHAVGSPLFEVRTYVFGLELCSETYYAYAEDVAPGSPAGGFSPGVIREPEIEVDQHFGPTFIPTDSALDMRDGVSMFDRILVQLSAQDHTTITQETHNFILEELLGSDWRVNVKIMPDGSNVNLSGKIVSAVYDGMFYIEETDRAWGVAVAGGASVAEGDVVSILGTMSTIEGERVVSASSVAVAGNGENVPGPVSMPCRSLGGGPYGLYTPGVLGGMGLNNVGLLVRCAGRVTGVAPDQTFFYIDDGSSQEDGSGYAGVRVALTGLFPGETVTAPPIGA